MHGIHCLLLLLASDKKMRESIIIHDVHSFLVDKVATFAFSSLYLQSLSDREL